VSSRSSVATLQTAIHLLLPYMSPTRTRRVVDRRKCGQQSRPPMSSVDNTIDSDQIDAVQLVQYERASFYTLQMLLVSDVPRGE